MAERRRRETTADPRAAAEWRKHARYLASPVLADHSREELATVSDRALLAALRGVVGDGEPVPRVRDALAAAEEGRPFRPYTATDGRMAIA